MPRYNPNTRFSDCWSSVGEVTFYHRDGVCYWKKRAHPEFPGTMGQMEAQSVHLRALQAWRTLSPAVQEQWNSLAVEVPSHRPPFRKDHHITGHNLFVSAYHGFAQLGNEHIPVPHAYESFPVFTCEFSSAASAGEDLILRFRVRFFDDVTPSRYRLAVRLQLTRPGAGRQPGFLRSFIAQETCTSSDCVVDVVVPGYKDIWNLDLDAYQVHCRYLLLDATTGYRCNFKKMSFPIDL